MAFSTVERHRHAPLGRSRLGRLAESHSSLPRVYRGRGPRALTDIYDPDHLGANASGRFRWLLSTCLAAGVGAVAIGVVVFGSLDTKEGRDAFMPTLKKIGEGQLPTQVAMPAPRPVEGLNWATPKADRLQGAVGSTTAKHIIHERIQIKRDSRAFLEKRAYMRIVARLVPVPFENAGAIPAFNPFRLYSAAGEDASEDFGGPSYGEVAIRIVELLGSILPAEDGQEFDTQEIGELIARAQEESEPAALRVGFAPEGIDLPLLKDGGDTTVADRVPPNTTDLAKSTGEAEEPVDLEGREVRSVRVGRGDTLAKILQRMGADTWQARSMADAAKSVLAEGGLTPGLEVRVTLVPSLTRADRMEPARFSVHTETGDHKVSVVRNAAGEFVASLAEPDARVLRAGLSDSDEAPPSISLYASFYNAALGQGVPPDTIFQLLRIHAYETDFRRRVRNGDTIEQFFDVREDGGLDSTPGDLLFTSIVAGGEVRKFWRFRTQDGIVDYYDESGDNSKKFLMRRPVRGEAVRFTSGYGMRVHPILNIARPHNGVDWSAPSGTPVLAAGNGIVEEADRKSQYGNYVRIRHANGYHTAYGHLERYGAGVRPGAKVRQGQIIGYVGSTGLSSGPHLHYEVLVNSRHVDPLQIQVPRERRLTGKQLQDFQKERARIDELMRRAPVITASR